jgi:hypothetical protein
MRRTLLVYCLFAWCPKKTSVTTRQCGRDLRRVTQRADPLVPPWGLLSTRERLPWTSLHYHNGFDDLTRLIVAAAALAAL